MKKTDDDMELLDFAGSACLCDIGGGEYIAAVAVGADGEQRLVLAERGSVGDEAVRYDPTCSEATHEQLGPLPLEYVRRLTISRRGSHAHRCGRPTKAGTPCKIPVSDTGAACGFHRT